MHHPKNTDRRLYVELDEAAEAIGINVFILRRWADWQLIPATVHPRTQRRLIASAALAPYKRMADEARVLGLDETELVERIEAALSQPQPQRQRTRVGARITERGQKALCF